MHRQMGDANGALDSGFRRNDEEGMMKNESV